MFGLIGHLTTEGDCYGHQRGIAEAGVMSTLTVPGKRVIIRTHEDALAYLDARGILEHLTIHDLDGVPFVQESSECWRCKWVETLPSAPG